MTRTFSMDKRSLSLEGQSTSGQLSSFDKIDRNPKSGSKFCGACGGVNPMFPLNPAFCSFCGITWELQGKRRTISSVSEQNQQSDYESDMEGFFSKGEKKGLSQIGVPKPNVKFVPDCDDCELCKASFTIFRRKHHCRTCGHVFCSDCRSKKLSVTAVGFSFTLPVRVN